MIDNNGNVNGRFRSDGPVRLVSPDDVWYGDAGGYGRNAYREGSRYRDDLKSVTYSPGENVNFTNLLGYTAEEFDSWSGSSSGEISRDSFRDGLLNSFLGLDQSQDEASKNASNWTKGIMAAFDVEGDPNDHDYDHRAPNGSLNLFELAAYKLYLDGADGKKDGVIHVEDAKKAKEHLAQLASSDKQEDKDELLKIRQEASDTVFDEFHSTNTGKTAMVDRFKKASDTLKTEEKKAEEASPSKKEEEPDSEGTAGSAAGKTGGSGDYNDLMKQFYSMMTGFPMMPSTGSSSGGSSDMDMMQMVFAMVQWQYQQQMKMYEMQMAYQERMVAKQQKRENLQMAFTALGSIFGASRGLA